MSLRERLCFEPISEILLATLSPTDMSDYPDHTYQLKPEVVKEIKRTIADTTLSTISEEGKQNVRLLLNLDEGREMYQSWITKLTYFVAGPMVLSVLNVEDRDGILMAKCSTGSATLYICAFALEKRE